MNSYLLSVEGHAPDLSPYTPEELTAVAEEYARKVSIFPGVYFTRKRAKITIGVATVLISLFFAALIIWDALRHMRMVDDKEKQLREEWAEKGVPCPDCGARTP